MLTLPKQVVVFVCLLYTSFENIVGKGEIALNKEFLPFPVFSILFDRILIGQHFQFRRV